MIDYTPPNPTRFLRPSFITQPDPQEEALLKYPRSVFDAFQDVGRFGIWEFPKVGDPHEVPYIVGSLL